jgi:hypothetical protein
MRKGTAMNDHFHDEPAHLRLPPAPKTGQGMEPLLSRIFLGISVALIPAICFDLPGLLLGEAGETKSILLMIVAVTAAVVALFQAWRARLRRAADRPAGLLKSIAAEGDIIAMVPVRDLAALDLVLIDNPTLAVEQALNLFKVMVRLLSSIFVVAPLALAWEMLFLFAFGGLKMPLLHAAVTGSQIIRIGDLARSLIAFDALVVSFGAVIMLVAGKQPSRRFGFRNIYRDRRDAYLREQFSVSDDEAITIAIASPRFTPVHQRSF